MNVVGRIDRTIYSCISTDITTDEVIITDTQIAHIRERHPMDYERFSKYFNEILSNPDYILEANRPNTAFVLKTIDDCGEKFELILRIHTSKDTVGHKNSIITYFKITDRKFLKYLRNKKILYKRT